MVIDIQELKSSRVKVYGAIIGNITSYFIEDKEIYKFKIKSERKTGKYDIINVHLPKNIADDINLICQQTAIGITGELRTHFNDENDMSEVIVFAEEISPHQIQNTQNTVNLIGTICTNPYIKQTYKGKTIAIFEVEIIDYTNDIRCKIPIVGFNKIVDMIDILKPKTPVEIQGRLESRVIFTENKIDRELKRIVSHDVATSIILKILDTNEKLIQLDKPKSLYA
ncbi:MAG: single-stranded DNA-binding protein [Defluviitaleaceae bacterium]|nr:single-stranded DNA-binding protein [Defluviitaleaceae bacterium]